MWFRLYINVHVYNSLFLYHKCSVINYFFSYIIFFVSQRLTNTVIKKKLLPFDFAWKVIFIFCGRTLLTGTVYSISVGCG